MNDDLLSRPLPSVADNGFSAQVMSRIETARRRRVAFKVAAFALCVLIAALLLPLGTVGATLSRTFPHIASVTLTVALSQLVSSWAVNFALAAIVLSILLERQLSRL